jgi:tetratricopeptide (TPR) repeat protein
MHRWIPLVLVVVGVVTHLNALDGEFIYDDRTSILPEPAIRSLWPPWQAMWAEEDSSFAGRPVVTYTLALNYAFGEFEVRGYRAVNLAIHLLCALALYGLVRRTLQLPRLRKGCGESATPLAASVALLWMVHPIQTECIAYVTSRTESIAGLFYLLTLYGAARSLGDGPKQARWSGVAIAACALGMASKESMVTAPVLVVLYDLCFGMGTPRALLRRRRGLYAGLAASWLVLAAIMLSAPRGASVGFDLGVHPVEYFLNQCWLIVHYLGLVFVPHPLILDYGPTRPFGIGDVAPQILLLSALGVATLVGLVKRHPLGFLGACVFVILAPTSSFIPIVTEVGSERRMYLPLAAVLAALVLAVHQGLTRAARAGLPDVARRAVAGVLVVGIACALAFASARRERDYRSRLAIWSSVVSAMPDNPQGHFVLGNVLQSLRRIEPAGTRFERALELKPDFGHARVNLAAIRVAQGRHHEAEGHYREAIRLEPDLVYAYINLAMILQRQGRLDEAVEVNREALRIGGDSPEPLRALAVTLATHPDRRRRQPDRAVDYAERAVALTARSDVRMLDALAEAYAAADRLGDAREALHEALALAEAQTHPLTPSLRQKLARLGNPGPAGAATRR